jgi:hypothetical protein
MENAKGRVKPDIIRDTPRIAANGIHLPALRIEMEGIKYYLNLYLNSR